MYSYLLKQTPDTSLQQLSPLVQQAEALLLKAKPQKAKKLYLQALAIKDDYLPALRGLAGVQEMENDFVAAAATLVKDHTNQSSFFSGYLF